VHKRFGGVHALRGAALDVRAGEVHALVGENGSGKSTLLRIVGGQLRADAGVVEVGGRVAVVSQETTLVPDLSVAENIYLGHRQASRLGFVDWGATRRAARTALTRLALPIDPTLPARRLRPDEAQMVEIARALSMDARILVLDEPTSSLTDDEVATLFDTVRALREDGVAVIFVSRRLNEVFALADRVTVLRDGHTVASGDIGEYDAARLVEAMVGRALEDFEPSAAGPAAEPMLRIRGLGYEDVLHDIDLDVGRGEVVGLAGLVGAGRTELLECLFGLRRATGTVELAGRPVAYRRPADAMRDGVAFVPADRKRHGLVLGRSVRENLLMASTSQGLRLRPPRRARETAAVASAIDRFAIRTRSPAATTATLSGGNQQKVLLGKWLATGPRLLMLDEPTRGVDVGAKAEIYRLLHDARSRDVGVLVCSSEVPELLALCDRIVVMFRGRVVASLPREQATEARIAHYAGGQA
jgi:ABC-type sugar transport system ATPase subunit